MKKIRQPIVTVVGHVDHGKTSILDFFRETSVQAAECGGITQKISYTKYPLMQIRNACPLIDSQRVRLDIPGFLFIDTPGHAAFTNLRKRGGNLADLAILVVSIKEGIKPQTFEVLQILKNNKVPFLVALNKIDTISGWQTHIGNLKGGIARQPMNVFQEFQESLLTFQASLQEHGFDSDLYYDIKDFSKKVAIVPCSAKTGEGISELLFVLCGLCQGFLKERLKVSEKARGVILEVRKGKGMDFIESILYDGTLKKGDEIAVGSFGEPIVTKVRSMEEIEPLCFRYRAVEGVSAATGVRLHLTNKEGVLSGMPFQKVDDNFEGLRKELKREVSGALNLDKEGIIVKADSLGSLDALIFLLRQEGIKIVKAGIGPIGKSDIVSAKANLEINPLNAVVLGFNVGLEDDLDLGNVKVFSDEVVYKLIENLQKWKGEKQSEIERGKLMELAGLCKLEILHRFVFRNSNPAVFGVRVLSGRLETGQNLIDENGAGVARVKSMQKDKDSVHKAVEGDELAISLPGVNFERRLASSRFLYSDIGKGDFKNFKKNKELLSANELKVLEEIARVKDF